MADREDSREAWEQELVDAQRGITFEEGRRRSEIITKKLSASSAPIADFAHLLMLLFASVFFAVAFLIFSSEMVHNIAVGLVVLAAGLTLLVAAFWRTRRPG